MRRVYESGEDAWWQPPARADEPLVIIVDLTGYVAEADLVLDTTEIHLPPEGAPAKIGDIVIGKVVMAWVERGRVKAKILLDRR